MYKVSVRRTQIFNCSKIFRTVQKYQNINTTRSKNPKCWWNIQIQRYGGLKSCKSVRRVKKGLQIYFYVYCPKLYFMQRTILMQKIKLFLLVYFLKENQELTVTLYVQILTDSLMRHKFDPLFSISGCVPQPRLSQQRPPSPCSGWRHAPPRWCRR